jgi:hypothetical protein
MKHSFKFKKSEIKSVFQQKLGIKNLSIENKNDVFNTVSILLNFNELEEFFTPVDCSYGFFNNQVIFTLKLQESKDKKDFFVRIREFETFMEIE